MKTSSILVSATTGAMLSVALLACSMASGSGDEAAAPAEENLGTAQQALCRTPPCVKVGPTNPPPVYDPGPVAGPSFSCTGGLGTTPDGLPKYQTVTGSCSETSASTTCTCETRAVAKSCWPPPDGSICYGFTVLSNYICASPYPKLRCNAFGDCTCWSY